MAPAPQELSSPGTATYDSDRLSVGDGTWDFTKNTFLLPNLVGLPFDMMRYNGMGNRFSSVGQYHSIILAHGIMGAIVFLLLVPLSVWAVRFRDARPRDARRLHTQVNIFAGLMLLVVFMLGYFAVGPERSLTNPHHGIGVAIFLLFILQLFGGWVVNGIHKLRSFRIVLHQWSGRAIGLLGVVQVPLGLALYGSPLYTFILYAVWMAFLALLYFIMDYRRLGREDYRGGRHDAHSGITGSQYPATDITSDDVGKGTSKWKKWITPLVAFAGVLALLKGNKKSKDRGPSRSRSRSRSRSQGMSRRSRSYSRSRIDAMSAAPTSYFDSEKYDDDDGRNRKGPGWMSKLLPGAGALGAWKLGARGKSRGRDEEYSAVSTDTPSRPPRRGPRTETDLSEISDQYRRDPRMHPTRTAESSGPGGPRYPAHTATYSGYSYDNESYESPSRRPAEGGRGGGAAKGLLAGMGLGWLASKFGKKKAPPPSRYDDDRYTYDDDDSRIDGSRYTGYTGYTGNTGYTGDPYTSPPRNGRRNSRRPSRGGRRSSISHAPTEDSSVLEPRHGTGPGPPMPPLSHMAPRGLGDHHASSGGAAPPTGSHRDVAEPVDMPPMPPDPESPSDRLGRRDSSRRRRAGEDAAVAAAATASALAAEEDSRRRRGESRGRRSRDRDGDGGTPTRPPRTTIKMTVHDDRVNLRRLTDEEASKPRRFRRADSASSVDEADTPPRRYRRDSSSQRPLRTADSDAQQQQQQQPAPDRAPDSPLSPPHPAFASGVSRRPKDSTYYSGQLGGGGVGGGPSFLTPQHQQGGGGGGGGGGFGGGGHHTVSSLGSGSHGTWSEAMSPSPNDRPAGSAADNRRRRRLERRRSVSSRPVGTDMFD